MSEMLSNDGSKISSIDFGKDAHSLPQRCINLQNLAFIHQYIDIIIGYSLQLTKSHKIQKDFIQDRLHQILTEYSHMIQQDIAVAIS